MLRFSLFFSLSFLFSALFCLVPLFSLFSLFFFVFFSRYIVFIFFLFVSFLSFCFFPYLQSSFCFLFFSSKWKDPKERKMSISTISALTNLTVLSLSDITFDHVTTPSYSVCQFSLNRIGSFNERKYFEGIEEKEPLLVCLNEWNRRTISVFFKKWKKRTKKERNEQKRGEKRVVKGLEFPKSFASV